ncbi:DNA polymerase III subunit gamma and tau [Actinomadura chibensis]|uniref:DNA-directed DNA polymerase n=1 Tax=Actinomadura chibensis TaxID=392828 RepID=A0A5D0NXE2_9ACTN|nr:DNA polymerase III subunit gamma and tau [Actinomadura chibensis]TYB49216.1 DNA polymerase III subunit gamma and tau [Actinomadura chibensis]
MSLALYRKYRPATFAELKGQEHVAEPLQQALRNGRINHAYLFSGPRGCGKTSSARILARSLNCEKGPTPDPCGVCDSCVALGPSGTGHIDVIEIDAASHGGVDDARDLRERAFFAPVSARFKVYIIDEAHMVTREGFNALLKLVEEPPPHLKFVFATTEPEKVIGTIRSRTHHYPFRLIPPGVLQELVEEILRAEDVPYETSALPLAVRAGAGSARDTLSILDQLLAGSDEKGITYARAVSLLGYTDSALLDEVIAAFAGRDGAAVFAAIDRVVESGQDPRRFTADLLERIRDLVILSNVPEAGGTGLLNVPPDELEQMRRQASSMGAGELTRAADLLHTGLTEMRGATSPRLLLELICARILLPAAYEDEASLLARLDRLERQAAQGGQGGFAGGAAGGGPAPAFSSVPQGGFPQGGGPPARGADAPESGPQHGGAAPGGAAHGGAAHGGAAHGGSQRGVGQQGGGPQQGGAQPGAAGGADAYQSREAQGREVQAREAQGRESQGREVQAREAQGRESQGREVQTRGSQARDSQGRDSQGPNSQGRESQGPNSQGREAQGHESAAAWENSSPREEQSPPSQGGDPNSSVNPAQGPSEAERGPVDNRRSPSGGGPSGGGSSEGWASAQGGSAAPAGAPSSASGGGDFSTVQQLWPDVVEAVKQKSRATWMVIMSGVQPVSLDGKVLTLGFDAEGRRLGFVNGGRDAVLREVFKERMGVDWRIETVVGGGPPAAPPPGRPGPNTGFGGAATPNPAPQPRPQPTAQAHSQSRPPVPRAESVPEPPPPPDEPPPPPEPMDESDEVDPEGDADVDGTEAEMTGMALIQRELGGQIIREIDNSSPS